MASDPLGVKGYCVLLTLVLGTRLRKSSVPFNLQLPAQLFLIPRSFPSLPSHTSRGSLLAPGVYSQDRA